MLSTKGLATLSEFNVIKQSEALKTVSMQAPLKVVRHKKVKKNILTTMGIALLMLMTAVDNKTIEVTGLCSEMENTSLTAAFSRDILQIKKAENVTTSTVGDWDRS